MKPEPINPYEPPRKPSSAGMRRLVQSRFTRWHGITLAVIWAGFTLLTFSIVYAGADEGSGRARAIILTTMGTILGPMTGAISRDFQSCCLEFSLSLLPYAAAFPIVGTVAQLVRWPFEWGAGALRMLLWIVGWLGWFLGGIVSFGHALS